MNGGEDCSNCKHHSKRQIEKEIDLLFVGSEIIQRGDELEDIYDCKFPEKEKEVGRQPIYCDNYESSVKRSLTQIDEMIEKWNKRSSIKKTIDE